MCVSTVWIICSACLDWILIKNELKLNAIEHVIIIVKKIKVIGKNRLWRDFYDPVSQNDWKWMKKSSATSDINIKKHKVWMSNFALVHAGKQSTPELFEN